MSVAPITYVDARHTCPAFPIPPQTDLKGRVVINPKTGKPDRWAKREPRPLPIAVGFHISDCVYDATPKQIARCGSRSAARLWRFTAQRHTRTYHWFTDHEERRIIRKLPADVWSAHGDGMNRFTIGHCYEAKRGGVFDWELAIESIVRCVETERRDGSDIRYGYAHAQFDAKDDPGEEYWRRAVMPAAAYLKLELDVDSKAGNGSPIKPSWRQPWIEVQS